MSEEQIRSYIIDKDSYDKNILVEAGAGAGKTRLIIQRVIGQIRVYGSDNKNMQWNINSQDEIISFKTKLGEQERQTYETLSGKNYIMKRTENECVWTVFKNDIKELAEKEKKRNVVNEDLEKHNIFEELEKEVANSPTLTEDKNIEINIADEKEVGE